MSSYHNNSKTGRRLQMTTIRQGSQFDLQELYHLEPTHRFEAVFSNNVRYRKGKRANIHFDLVTLVYSASKLASDRINALLNQQQIA